MDGINEAYSVDLAQKIKRGMTDNAIGGEFNGGGYTFGYKIVNQKFVVDEAQAKVVKHIFEVYADSKLSINGVKNIINSEGHMGKSGKTFSQNAIMGILTNRRYIEGVLVPRDDQQDCHSADHPHGFVEQSREEAEEKPPNHSAVQGGR